MCNDAAGARNVTQIPRMGLDDTHFTGPGCCPAAQSSYHTGCSTDSTGSGSGNTVATAEHTERQKKYQ